MTDDEFDLMEALMHGEDFASGVLMLEWLRKYSGSPSAMDDPGRVARVYHGDIQIADYDPDARRLTICNEGNNSRDMMEELNAVLLAAGCCYMLNSDLDGVWYMVKLVGFHSSAQCEWKGVAHFTADDMFDRQ